MPVSSVTSESKPALVSNPPSLAGTVDFAKSLGGNCPTNANKVGSYIPGCLKHHGVGASGFPSLGSASTLNTIHHSDINSMKYAFNSLVSNWSQGGNQDIFASKATFTKSAGQLIRRTEWDQINNIILQFSALSGGGVTPPSTLTAAFHNELKSKYDLIKNSCLCNSDCSCNNVCTCNGDCGCNYSDKRLKKNIIKINEFKIYDTNLKKNIIVNFYSFYYKQDNIFNLPIGKQFGVMAQELLESGLDKYVIQGEYYQVNYDKLYRDLKCTIQG